MPLITFTWNIFNLNRLGFIVFFHSAPGMFFVRTSLAHVVPFPLILTLSTSSLGALHSTTISTLCVYFFSSPPLLGFLCLLLCIDFLFHSCSSSLIFLLSNLDWSQVSTTRSFWANRSSFLASLTHYHKLCNTFIRTLNSFLSHWSGD